MANFYSGLEPQAFWRSGVAEVNPESLENIYRKKWDIHPGWQIGTAGSCFAQHIARYMKRYGYKVMDVEPAPKGLPAGKRPTYGFGMYSARYGNIYTARQLRQLVQETFEPGSAEPLIWREGGKFFDALRPNVEPTGYYSECDVLEARAYHINRLRVLFTKVDLFVFTLGLTEAWVHGESGRVVPVAPGVIAGADVADDYEFVNFGFADVLTDLRKTMNILKANRVKPLQYVLTVSPVPLTATATGGHVLAATTYSKSVLRAVAGQLYAKRRFVDYFPSYEIITNPGARGAFFEDNLRSVRSEGVEVVMQSFFAEHPPHKRLDVSPQKTSLEEVQCEEALLGAFGR